LKVKNVFENNPSQKIKIDFSCNYHPKIGTFLNLVSGKSLSECREAAAEQMLLKLKTTSPEKGNCGRVPGMILV
jgi:hypothetical protein